MMMMMMSKGRGEKNKEYYCSAIIYVKVLTCPTQCSTGFWTACQIRETFCFATKINNFNNSNNFNNFNGASNKEKKNYNFSKLKVH